MISPDYQGPFTVISEKMWENRFEKGFQNDFIQKINQAARLGFFYLEIPVDCRTHLDGTLRFANDFYNHPKYKNIKHEGFTAYNDRKEFQNESLYLEKKYWETYLNPEWKECLAITQKMHQLSTELLRTIYQHFGILESDYEKASGGLSENKGQVHLTFNHYRHERAQEGLPAHKDFGQITVLFTDKMGLQTKQDEDWVNVPPLKDHFIINFGETLELLINDPAKLIAAEHRVLRLAEDRISFGVFGDNDGKSPLYQRQGDKLVIIKNSAQEYLQEKFAKLYTK